MIEADVPQLFLTQEREPGDKVPERMATFGPALALARGDEAIE